jgi:RNA polymerase sigma factor (sigma-70 family)
VGDPDDAAMVDGLRRGDRAAFEQVFARFRPRIYGFLWRLARDPEVAMDLVQETFMSLARTSTKLDAQTNLAAWLFTVARNAYRSHRRWALLDASRWAVLDDDLAIPTQARGPDDSVDAARARGRLERAILSLPEAQREVLLLVAVEGMSHDEAAKILSITPEAARQRLSRARSLLADRLSRLEKKQ